MYVARATRPQAGAAAGAPRARVQPPATLLTARHDAAPPPAMRGRRQTLDWRRWSRNRLLTKVREYPVEPVDDKHPSGGWAA